MIALVGNPFSASYARARARARDPRELRALDYCALNIAVYGPRNVWSLNERRIDDEARARDQLHIGGSTIAYREGGLVIDVDERTTPFGGRGGKPLRGRITLVPDAVSEGAFALDREAQHRWWPIAPSARIEVALDTPQVAFTGHGYHDANAGDVPLEHTFSAWSWARTRGSRSTLVAYEAMERSGTSARHVLEWDDQGRHEGQSITRARLPASRWQLARAAFGDADEDARIVRSLEDGPFYARDLVASTWRGERVVAMHETLSCDRLAAPWVRFLAGFRTG